MSLESGGSSEGKEPTESIERITVAAIKYRGDTFMGHLHSDAWNLMNEKYPGAIMTEKNSEFGFMTSAGRFVSREEALKIADKAEQLKHGPRNPDSILLQEELKEGSDK